MYSFISGTVASNNDNILVVDNNGIGYEFFISPQTAQSLSVGDNARIFTYLQFSENTGIVLYGFSSAEEKNMFLKLITVSGIGPKNAIGILSKISIADLSIAIAREDLALLNAKGIGKKTAERLVVELKDKIDIYDTAKANAPVQDNDAINEACMTLVSLGMNKNDALVKARASFKEGDTTEDIIARSLRGK